MTQYLREEEDEMTKVEYSEKFQVQHLGPQVIVEILEKAPQTIFQTEERKRN